MDTTYTPPAPYGPGSIGIGSDMLKMQYERATAEAMGARALFNLVRPSLSFPGHEAALAHLCQLDALATAAKQAFEAGADVPLLATAEQRQTLYRLLTHPLIKPSEKEGLLLELPRRNMESAAVLILSLKLDINARAGYAVFPEVAPEAAPYAVVGEVFFVEAQTAA